MFEASSYKDYPSPPC